MSSGIWIGRAFAGTVRIPGGISLAEQPQVAGVQNGGVPLRMSMTGASYPIARSTGICAATGRALVVGERYVAALIERTPDSAALERADFSLDAWNQGARPAAPARTFGVWRASFHEHVQAPKPLLDDDELLDLFEQLGEATAANQIAFRYVLTLLLVRRRLLRMMGSKPRTPDRPALMMVVPKGQGAEMPPIEVVDPGLDDAAVAEVIEQVGQIIATTD